jgi:hypothetical protein
MRKGDLHVELFRIELWIRKPESADQLTDCIGKHLVAYPGGSVEEKSGGQLIAVNPDARTASLRRYDTGEIREFPWRTTDFRQTAVIESPFAELPVGVGRRFEWFYGDDGRAVDQPITLVGTVDLVKPDVATLWVRDARYEEGGWWAELKAEDAARHALRPVNLKSDRA